MAGFYVALYFIGLAVRGDNFLGKGRSAAGATPRISCCKWRGWGRMHGWAAISIHHAAFDDPARPAPRHCAAATQGIRAARFWRAWPRARPCRLHHAARLHPPRSPAATHRRSRPLPVVPAPSPQSTRAAGPSTTLTRPACPPPMAPCPPRTGPAPAPTSPTTAPWSRRPVGGQPAARRPRPACPWRHSAPAGCMCRSPPGCHYACRAHAAPLGPHAHRTQRRAQRSASKANASPPPPPRCPPPCRGPGLRRCADGRHHVHVPLD